MPSKKYMIQNVGVNLHFSSQNLGYVAAYKYICKNKSTDDVLLNPGHVNLNTIGSPHTTKFMKAFEANAKVRRESVKQVKHHARLKVKAHIQNLNVSVM